MIKRTINWPLMIGVCMLILIGVVLLFPERLASHNPYTISTIQFWQDPQGQLQIATAPYAPGPQYPLGSDQLGRDLVSFIAYGMRMTLFAAVVVTLLRMIIAIPSGMASALGNTGAKQLIHKVDRLFVTLPPLLAAVLLLRTDWFTSLERAESLSLFIILLALVGWSKLGTVFEKTAGKIAAETYIDSERALGKSKFQIAKAHLLPHMLPEITVLFFMEIAQVLTLMMQLGLFSVFIGNLKVVKDSAREGYSFFNITFEPEWSSLLGTARDYIRVAPWIALCTGAAFFFTVFAFNLVGEGLRMRFQKHNGGMRHPLNAFKKRSVQGGIVVMVLLIVVTQWPEQHTFMGSDLTLPKTLESPVLPGSKASQSISNTLETYMSTLGLVALTGAEGYRQSFELPPQIDIERSELTWQGKALPYLEDYRIVSGTPGVFKGTVQEATTTYYSSQKIERAHQWLLLDANLIEYTSIAKMMAQLKAEGVSGILLKGVVTPSLMPKTDLPVVWVSDNFAKQLDTQLKTNPKAQFETLTLDLKGNITNRKGANLFAKMGGTDPMLARSTVIIGMDISAMEGEKTLEKTAFYSNLMKTLYHYAASMDRTMVFAFFDGKEGLQYYSDHSLVQNQHVTLFLDLTDLRGENYEQLVFSRELSPISRYYGYGFADKLERIGKTQIDAIDPLLSSDDRLLFDLEGLTTLRLSTEGQGHKPLTDVGTLILETMMEVTQ